MRRLIFFYNWNRYYHPQLGRYIASDPIGLRGGLNTFGYALQNPLYWVDPKGLDVTVSFDPDGAGGFGHVGLNTNSRNTVGQRPQSDASGLKTVMGFDVPGEISLDKSGKLTLTIPTTPEQDKQVQQCIDTRKKEKQDYNLYDNNCVHFVGQCLGSANIPTLNTKLPRKMFNDLDLRFNATP